MNEEFNSEKWTIDLKKKFASYKELARKQGSDFYSNYHREFTDLSGCFLGLQEGMLDDVMAFDHGDQNNILLKALIKTSKKVRSLIRFYELISSDFPEALTEDSEAFIRSQSDIDNDLFDLSTFDYVEEDYKDDQSFLFADLIPCSMVVNLLASIENFLDDVVSHAAAVSGEVKEVETKGTYIDQHINLLRKAYGIPIKLDKEVNKKLTMMREERNRFLHQISRDLPDEIKKYYTELLGSSKRRENNHDFVYHAFEVTFEVLKVVTTKCLAWQETGRI